MNVACLGAFSGTITAQTNSAARITFTVTSGALPTGLSMTSSGKLATIAGTITAVGTFTFVVRATLATGEYAAAQYVVYVAAVANDELDDGTVGSGYSQTLTVSGPTEGASTWAVISGALPAGLSLNASTGEISGTPTTEADYSFTVRFTNTLTSCSKAFSISIGVSSNVLHVVGYAGFDTGGYPTGGGYCFGVFTPPFAAWNGAWASSCPLTADGLGGTFYEASQIIPTLTPFQINDVTLCSCRVWVNRLGFGLDMVGIQNNAGLYIGCWTKPTDGLFTGVYSLYAPFSPTDPTPTITIAAG